MQGKHKITLLNIFKNPQKQNHFSLSSYILMFQFNTAQQIVS